MEMEMKNNANSSAFWNFLSGLVSFEAPLWNWRLRMGNAIDFEKFRSAFLHPEERFTTLIMCPEQCSASCGFRKVKTTVDGTHKAVCHQHLKPAFMVSNREVLMHDVNMATLLSGVAQALEIEPRITPFKTWEQVWDMGCKKIGSLPIKVFFTLRNWDHEVIDLILNLNRMLNEKYILLVSSRDLVSRTSKMALEDNKAVFIPLNEVLDFNPKAEPMLMRPLEPYLEPLIPKVPEPVIRFGRITLEIHDDADYWFVDGELKKVYRQGKRHSIQSRILKILYDQIANGWIPHQTFLNSTGWTAEEYFGGNDDSGRMQKQLFLIRRDFDLEIIFSREHGVKLSPTIADIKT